jgi:hypothetical protein
MRGKFKPNRIQRIKEVLNTLDLLTLLDLTHFANMAKALQSRPFTSTEARVI